jgi:hypothetical protein
MRDNPIYTTVAMDVRVAELSREAQAFLHTLDGTRANQVTACRGWTVHELVAHCAAGPAERAHVLEAALAGQPNPPTRGFAEREAPFRALSHPELRARLVYELQRFATVNALLAGQPDPAVTFTGWRMTAAELDTHGRSELALHRWDMAGDDACSMKLLAQPELLTHAVKLFGALPQLAESPAQRARRAGLTRDHPLAVRLRTPGDERDVVVHLDGEATRVALAPRTDAPALVTTAAGRLLLLWGRTLSPQHPTYSALTGEELETLSHWLFA